MTNLKMNQFISLHIFKQTDIIKLNTAVFIFKVKVNLLPLSCISYFSVQTEVLL